MVEKRPDRADELRRRAEEIARRKATPQPADLESLSPEAVRAALHDLQVHQIELEMQNEELRQAQVELEASRARYFDLYDLAPVGYVTVSEQGLIVEANLAAANLLGIPRGVLVEQPFSRFIARDDQDIYYRRRKLLFETEAPQMCELRLNRKDGALLWVQLEAAIARAADGSPTCRVVLSDVTERTRMEEEKANLEERRQQLQKAESLRRMSAAIAHRFNNLLQIVMANLELAAHSARADATGLPRRLAAAMDAARRAAEIISLTLTYLGQPAGKRGALDLGDTCRRGLRMLEAAMPKNVALETDVPVIGPAVDANGDQMLQILTNLVTNGWEAIETGRGVVRVMVKTVSAAEIPGGRRFPADWRPREGAHVCLEVADSGTGIAPENVGSIFDPFYSSKFLGRGMGLAVVLGIVGAHSGGVTVASEIGRGSTFRVFLPASHESVPRQPDQATQTLDMKGTGTVLLVDDDEIVRAAAGAMLRQLGFTVIEARDGVEALELSRQHREGVRCVLCDVTMPQMGGRETMAALRQMPSHVPVILASGYSEAQALAGGLGERPRAFLSKPYRLEQLNDALAHVLVDRG